MTADQTGAHGSVERSVQRYRRLLVLYPRNFREEFGEDLVQAQRDLLLFSSPGHRSSLRRSWDLIRSAAAEHAANLSKARKPIGAIIALALAGAAFLFILGEDGGYWVFVAAFGTLIASAVLGVTWAAIALLRPRGPQRRLLRPLIVLVPSLAVLGLIVGGSVHSYLRTVGPAGDHSIQNASAESEALWSAAGAGDLDEVVRLTTDTCADPWVRFTADDEGNLENARGHAIVRGPHADIERVLDDYMTRWHERCGQAGG